MIDYKKYDFCASNEKEHGLWVHSLAWIMLSNQIVGLPKGGAHEKTPSNSEAIIITGKLIFDNIMSKVKNKRQPSQISAFNQQIK